LFISTIKSVKIADDIVEFNTISKEEQEQIMDNLPASMFQHIKKFVNNIQDNLSITELKIGGNICPVSNNLDLGINEVPVSSCINNLETSTYDIVLITEKDIVSKTVYIKNSYYT
jgi:hypothetical protein